MKPRTLSFALQATLLLTGALALSACQTKTETTTTETKQETAMSPLESVSSKVVTAHRVKKCDTTYTKEFQIQAEVTLKSKKMGVVKSDNVKLACNFKVS